MSNNNLEKIKTIYYVSAHGYIPVSAKNNKASNKNILVKRTPSDVHLWMNGRVGCILQNSAKTNKQKLNELTNIIKTKKISNKSLGATTFLGPQTYYADTLLILKVSNPLNRLKLGVIKKNLLNNRNESVNIPTESTNDGMQTILLSKLIKTLNKDSLSHSQKNPILISVDACRKFGKRTKKVSNSNFHPPNLNKLKMLKKKVVNQKNVTRNQLRYVSHLYKTSNSVAKDKHSKELNELKDVFKKLTDAIKTLNMQIFQKQSIGVTGIFKYPNGKSTSFNKLACTFNNPCISNVNLNIMKKTLLSELNSSQKYINKYFIDSSNFPKINHSRIIAQKKQK